MQMQKFALALLPSACGGALRLIVAVATSKREGSELDSRKDFEIRNVRHPKTKLSKVK